MRSILLALALTLLSAASARAQLSDDDIARARDAFAAGEAAYSAERYAEAIEHFERAQSIDPHDVVRFNVAICLQRLGRWHDAWVEYDSLSRSTELDDAQRAYATELRADLEGRLGVLRIGASEPAEIHLDGAPIGAAPLETRVEPGPHVITARAGSREVTRRLTIERGQTLDLALTLPALDPLPALVTTPETRRVLRDPSWATYTGAAIAGVGIAGAIALGVHTEALHARYFSAGQATLALRDEGLLARDLTNGAIALAMAGAALLVIDVMLLLTGDGAREVEVASR
jgi:tetratricopeptide (TPR) repeat protein